MKDAEPAFDAPTVEPVPVRDVTTVAPGPAVDTPTDGGRLIHAADAATAADVPAGFDLLDELGSGGMGVVYRARDREIDREVAVKVVHREYRTEPTVSTRFHDEARITGQLQHPGIPPVYRVGRLPDGSPFMAMKLIKGHTLAELLKRNPTAVNRLGVFEAICQAVGYAHAHGVIHRDLKPANVMVGSFGEVQVMDWGLAKVLANPASRDREGAGSSADAPAIRSVRDSETKHGSALGTPAFMAPEQALGQVDQFDPRTDVFGLGGILCTMLTGAPPYAGATSEVNRLLAERAHLRDCFARLDASGVEPELVTLCKTCLSADKADRPADGMAVATAVAELRSAADERARRAELDREKAVVETREQRKRQRQFRWAAGVVGAVLLLGVIGTAIGLVVADNRRVEADLARQGEKDRADGEAEQARLKEEQRRIAEGAKEFAENRRQDAEESNTNLWAGLDAMTARIVGDSLGTQKAVSEEQKKFLNTVLPLYQKLTAKKGNDQATRERVAWSTFRVGLIEYRLGRMDESASAFRQAREAHATLAAEFPTVPEHLIGVATSHTNLGGLLREVGQRKEAEEQLRSGLAVFEKLVAEFPAVPEYQTDRAKCHGNLGIVLADLGQRKEAEEQFRKGLAVFEKLANDIAAVPEYRSDLATSHGNLGAVILGLGRRKEAEELFRKGLAVFEKLAAEFPAVPEYRSVLALSYIRLGDLLSDLGQRKEAVEQSRAALAVREKLAADFPAVPAYRSDLASSHTNLGTLLLKLGRRKEAEELFHKGLAVSEKLAAEFPAVPHYRSGVALSHTNLGMLLRDLKQWKEAEEHCRAGLLVREKLAAEFPTVPHHRSGVAKSHTNLGALLFDLKRWKEAEDQLRAGRSVFEKLAADFPALPEYRSGVAESHTNLAVLLRDLKRWKEAEDQLRAGRTVFEKLAADFPALPEYRSGAAANCTDLGVLLRDLGRRKEAEEQFRAGLAALEKLAAEFPSVLHHKVDLGKLSIKLGLLIQDGDEASECLTFFDKAIATLVPAQGAEPHDTTIRLYLRNSYWGRAGALDQLKKHAEAVKDWDRAVELSLGPTENQPYFRANRVASRLNAGQVAEAIVEVAELRKLSVWSARQLCNFAGVYSVASGKFTDKKQEHADAAMELLQKAVALGYKDTAELKTEKHLDPLRDREDFKKLLADLEAKFPPARELAPAPRPGM